MPLSHPQPTGHLRYASSIHDDLRRRKPAELVAAAPRCMLTFAGAGSGAALPAGCRGPASGATAGVVPAGGINGGGAADGDAGWSRELAQCPGVRFGVLVGVDDGSCIADAPAFGDGAHGGRGAGSCSSCASTSSNIGGARGGRGGPLAGGVVSVADYWRLKGFHYTEAEARRVVPVTVTLDGGGSFTCTYPADMVFRLGGHVDFPDSDGDDDGGDNDDADGGGGGTEPLNKRKQRRPLPWSAEAVLSPRDVLVAPPGYVLVSADYAQIEVRLLAHYSEDPNLIDAFIAALAGPSSKGRRPGLGPSSGGGDGSPDCNSADSAGAPPAGEDFFCHLARRWRRVPPGVAVSAAHRSAAKKMCYGILYGAGEARVRGHHSRKGRAVIELSVRHKCFIFEKNPSPIGG